MRVHIRINSERLSKSTSKSVEELNSYFRKSKKKTSKDLMGNNFDVYIKKYNSIFPVKKLGSGKYARTNLKNLEAGFRWFFDTYDYDWKVILEATSKYVEEYRLKNYEYMRTSQYFIRKQIDYQILEEVQRSSSYSILSPRINKKYLNKRLDPQNLNFLKKS